MHYSHIYQPILCNIKYELNKLDIQRRGQMLKACDVDVNEELAKIMVLLLLRE